MPRNAASTGAASRPRGAAPTTDPAKWLKELRELGGERWTEICQVLIAQALAGERWALEVFFKYAIGDPATYAGSDDDERLVQYLAEIREAMRSGGY